VALRDDGEGGWGWVLMPQLRDGETIVESRESSALRGLHVRSPNSTQRKALEGGGRTP
jgi:hypothetical protein